MPKLQIIRGCCGYLLGDRMDPTECVNAMRDRLLVKGHDNRESPDEVIGTIISVEIVGPDEIAAMVQEIDGFGRWECWPKDLEVIDPISQEYDDIMGIVRDENMEIID